LRIAALEKRIRALERSFLERGKPCNCRTGGQTTFHKARELQTMLQITCPAHGFRDLGHFRWLPTGLPLQADDEKFCVCPPSPLREFLQGRRGPLNEAELEEQERSWDRDWSPEADERYRRQSENVQRLFRSYELKRKTRGGINGNMYR
jgi:hypothetical protein